MSSLAGLPGALRRVRLSKGYRTLMAAQRATSVDASNISRYENGKATPDLATLERLLDGYGATVMDLARAIEAGCGDEDSTGADDAEELASVTKRYLEQVDEEALIELLRPVVRDEVARALRRDGG